MNMTEYKIDILPEINSGVYDKTRNELLELPKALAAEFAKTMKEVDAANKFWAETAKTIKEVLV
jgi:hypothetical protein